MLETVLLEINKLRLDREQYEHDEVEQQDFIKQVRDLIEPLTKKKFEPIKNVTFPKQSGEVVHYRGSEPVLANPSVGMFTPSEDGEMKTLEDFGVKSDDTSNVMRYLPQLNGTGRADVPPHTERMKPTARKTKEDLITAEFEIDESTTTVGPLSMGKADDSDNEDND